MEAIRAASVCARFAADASLDCILRRQLVVNRAGIPAVMRFVLDTSVGLAWVVDANPDPYAAGELTRRDPFV